MPLLKKICSLAIAFGLLACGPQVKLDDALIDRYIAAYKNIKSVSPALAKKMSSPQIDMASGQAGFAEMEQAIKKAGFKDFPEFVQVNSAVAWAFSQAQGGQFLKETDQRVKDGLGLIDKQLKDPKVPEAAKAQLRQQREQLKSQYEQNKPWADEVMKWTTKLTDEASVAVVKRRNQDLLAVFQGR